ncbi:hypothetical protein BASA50_002902 [Batrachochytrium salamandrivorans]|uniref:Uncharacterized protein n=1 Tax=Batrachochytrium salamandrivorans TaxID=1357716 RepID=A0ABQ8FJU7_9FUNG|nr:hypothetical protein BASA50_002902 [Batrachochytrium salamandrivorans]
MLLRPTQTFQLSDGTLRGSRSSLITPADTCALFWSDGTLINYTDITTQTTHSVVPAEFDIGTVWSCEAITGVGLLVVTSNKIHLLTESSKTNTQTGNHMPSPKYKPAVSWAKLHPYSSVAISPDGSYLSQSDQNRVIIRDIQDRSSQNNGMATDVDFTAPKHVKTFSPICWASNTTLLVLDGDQLRIMTLGQDTLNFQEAYQVRLSSIDSRCNMISMRYLEPGIVACVIESAPLDASIFKSKNADRVDVELKVPDPHTLAISSVKRMDYATAIAIGRIEFFSILAPRVQSTSPPRPYLMEAISVASHDLPSVYGGICSCSSTSEQVLVAGNMSGIINVFTRNATIQNTLKLDEGCLVLGASFLPDGHIVALQGKRLHKSLVGSLKLVQRFQLSLAVFNVQGNPKSTLANQRPVNAMENAVDQLGLTSELDNCHIRAISTHHSPEIRLTTRRDMLGHLGITVVDDGSDVHEKSRASVDPNSQQQETFKPEFLAKLEDRMTRMEQRQDRTIELLEKLCAALNI